MRILSEAFKRMRAELATGLLAGLLGSILLLVTPVSTLAGDAKDKPASGVLPDKLTYTSTPARMDGPEIKGLQIHWWINRVFDAYSSALARNRPTLVLFSARPCGFCKTMADKFRCPALARYAGEIEFAITYRTEDDGGDHLAAAFNVQRYPTTIMLRTDMDRLHVVGRIEGVFSAKEIDRVIAEGFKEVAQSGLRPIPRLRSIAETRRSLDRAGVTRPSEAFCAVGQPK